MDTCATYYRMPCIRSMSHYFLNIAHSGSVHQSMYRAKSWRLGQGRDNSSQSWKIWTQNRVCAYKVTSAHCNLSSVYISDVHFLRAGVQLSPLFCMDNFVWLMNLLAYRSEQVLMGCLTFEDARRPLLIRGCSAVWYTPLSSSNT